MRMPKCLCLCWRRAEKGRAVKQVVRPGGSVVGVLVTIENKDLLKTTRISMQFRNVQKLILNIVSWHEISKAVEKRLHKVQPGLQRQKVQKIATYHHKKLAIALTAKKMLGAS